MPRMNRTSSLISLIATVFKSTVVMQNVSSMGILLRVRLDWIRNRPTSAIWQNFEYWILDFVINLYNKNSLNVIEWFIEQYVL